jgi:hypothetical protein
MEDRQDDDSEAAHQLKRLLANCLLEARLKANEAAARLNISAERGYKYLNEANLNNNLPAYLLPLWTRMIGEDLLQYLSHEAG